MSDPVSHQVIIIWRCRIEQLALLHDPVILFNRVEGFNAINDNTIHRSCLQYASPKLVFIV